MYIYIQQLDLLELETKMYNCKCHYKNYDD